MAVRRVTDAGNPLDKPKNQGASFRQNVREREEISRFWQDSTDFAQGGGKDRRRDADRKNGLLRRVLQQSVVCFVHQSMGSQP